MSIHVDATLVPRAHIFDAEGDVPGAFAFEDDGLPPYNSLLYCCPCGCRQHISIPIATGDKQSNYWQWDGNRDTPTIFPSIRRLDGCRFHGWLRAGVWTGERE